MAARARKPGSRKRVASPRANELEARVKALEATCARLEAERALRALKARYAALVDARFVRGAPAPASKLAKVAREAAALFCEDAVWDGGPALGVARGREEIAALLSAPTLRFARHYFLNPQIEVAPDDANARAKIPPAATRRFDEHAGIRSAPTRRFDARADIRSATTRRFDARARWELLAPCTTVDGVPHWMSGFEDDTYRCVNGVWLHASMKLTALFMAPATSGWRKIFH